MSNSLQHTFPPPEPIGYGNDPRPILRRFCKPGDLVFDIGAHVGDRSRAMLALGCEVVAVEPQPGMFRVPEDQRLHFEEAVVSETVGEVDFFECPGSSYMSTISDERFRGGVQSHGYGYLYDPPHPVRSITLDWLIARYGLPSFIKIDVEGAELRVLLGLSQSVPALSFEVHDFDPEKLALCIDRLGQLGEWSYGYSVGESFTWQDSIPAKLGPFGDVYATLIS